ncbi:MAG: TetR/AcrR family transcriptional regulator [Treponema sp.]|nr:TetR/AcrR family transcriptional regulator [Treponema sp.]
MSGQVVSKREENKNARMQAIIECTFGLFAEHGIDPISMNDIADKANIGVASLYRYFLTKEDLAIAVATYAWNIEKAVFTGVFTSGAYNALDGFHQIQELLEIFEDALVTQRSFFSFVYYFDAFIKKENVAPERLQEYEKAISETNLIVVRALEKGIADGSISFNESENEVLHAATTQEMFITMMHSLFCLAQKLSISGELLDQDKTVESRRQIEILINMILVALKK